MLFSRLFRSRKSRPLVKPFTLPSRWSAAVLRFEPLDERVVPSFAEPTIYPVGPGAYSLAAADFTGDGILDLATQGGVLVGNGDGSFQPARLSPLPGESLLAGDVNGDGKADLIAVPATWSESRLNVMISNGDGSFQPAQPVTLPPATPLGYDGEPLPQSIASAAVGDFNDDGLLDLVVTGTTVHTIGSGDYDGYYDQTVKSTFANVLIGTGLGTFDCTATHDLVGELLGTMNNESTFGPDVGDFNGDGNLDFLTSYSNEYYGGTSGDYSALSAHLGNGDGTFQSARITSNYPGGQYIQHAVADFNEDGKTDVLIGGRVYGTTTVALGTADGTLTPMNPLNFDSYWSNPEVGDVNGDETPDLVFVGGLFGDQAVVILGNGDGTFAPTVTYSPGYYDYASPTLADFDGDGRTDLAAVDRNVGVIVRMSTGEWGPPPPELRITDASVAEGNSGTRSMTFTVSLAHAATGPVTVQYTTANGTAAAGGDYQAASGTLTFAPGETTKIVNVVVTGDRLAEPNEDFVVNLSNATNATIGDGRGAGTIVDDEPRISIGDATKKEGNGKKTTLFTFTVTLSAAYDQPVTMSFRTANGTATTSDSDYVARTGTLTFAPGETTKTITIEVKSDGKKESDETFYLDLFDNSSYLLFTKSRGIGAILNDD